MKHYTYTLIDGKPHIKAVNPHFETGNTKCIEYMLWDSFEAQNHPILWDGPEFEGRKPESEIEFTEQYSDEDENGDNIWIDFPFKGFIAESDTRQVAKLKQPVHETQESDHDLETCTEKEDKGTGETPIQEEEITPELLYKLGFDSRFCTDPQERDASKVYTLNGFEVFQPNENINEFIVAIEDAPIYVRTVKDLNKYQDIPVQEHKPESEDVINEFDKIAYKWKHSGESKLSYYLQFLGFEITKKI